MAFRLYLIAYVHFLFSAECGPNFTSKLEGMFRDMEISREMMSSFKEVSSCFLACTPILMSHLVLLSSTCCHSLPLSPTSCLPTDSW